MALAWLGGTECSDPAGQDQAGIAYFGWVAVMPSPSWQGLGVKAEWRIMTMTQQAMPSRLGGMYAITQQARP